MQRAQIISVRKFPFLEVTPVIRSNAADRILTIEGPVTVKISVAGNGKRRTRSGGRVRGVYAQCQYVEPVAIIQASVVEILLMLTLILSVLRFERRRSRADE